MPITTNRWQPDTCGCVCEYTFDSDEPGETRVHTFSTIEPCAIHEPVDEANIDVDRPSPLLGPREAPKGRPEAQYLACLDDNRIKNLVFKHAVEEIAELTFEVINPETGDPEKKQRYMDYEWHLGPDRVLTYSLKRGAGTGQFTALNKKVAGKRVKSATQDEFRRLRD